VIERVDQDLENGIKSRERKRQTVELKKETMKVRIIKD
jgi:hypothetical protein